MSLARIAVVGLMLIIGLSLAGAGGIAGPLALAGGLVLVLFLALGKATPGARTGHLKRARGLRQLGRYGDPALPFEAIAAGFAAWAIFETFVPTTVTLGPRFVAAGFCGLAFGLSTKVGIPLGLGGTAATLIGLSGTGVCLPSVASPPWSSIAAVAGVFVVSCAVVRLRLLPVPAPIGRQRGWALALALFAVVDLATFVAAPNNLDIWTGASPASVAVAGALIVFLAVTAAYGPRLVLGLLFIGMIAGQAYLLAADATMRWTLTDGVCDNPAATLVGVSVCFGASVVTGFVRPRALSRA